MVISVMDFEKFGLDVARVWCVSAICYGFCESLSKMISEVHVQRFQGDGRGSVNYCHQLIQLLRKQVIRYHGKIGLRRACTILDDGPSTRGLEGTTISFLLLEQVREKLCG